MDGATETVLEYTVIGSSAHSGHYVAENILVDNPSDQVCFISPGTRPPRLKRRGQTSRWSGAFPSPLNEQWILLRLEKPSVLSEWS
jgi:muskelin